MCLCASLTQCGVGLQAAGGQAAAVDEEAMPYRGEPLPPAALSPGALHLHSKTQVQSRVQKACALETLVPVKTTVTVLCQQCIGLMLPSYYFPG